MAHFKIICAVLMAWAFNWALSRPEAGNLLQELPEMEYVALAGAAFSGAFILGRRQGWGLIVGAANGVWAAIAGVALSGIFYVTLLGSRSVGIVGDFERWLQVLEGDLEPMFEQMLNFPLFLLTLAAGVVVGLVTELMHWALIRLKKNRGEYQEERGATTKRGNTQELW